MTTAKEYIYEGMFLFPQSHATDIKSAVDHVKEILGRAEAELIALSKWGERNLAFEIKKHKRGLYLLAYFKARSTQMANIERDCNLSEQVMRFMMTRADHLTLEEMQATDAQDTLHTEAKLRDEEPVAAGASAAPVAAAAPADAEPSPSSEG